MVLFWMNEGIFYATANRDKTSRACKRRGTCQVVTTEHIAEQVKQLRNIVGTMIEDKVHLVVIRVSLVSPKRQNRMDLCDEWIRIGVGNGIVKPDDEKRGSPHLKKKILRYCSYLRETTGKYLSPLVNIFLMWDCGGLCSRVATC